MIVLAAAVTVMPSRLRLRALFVPQTHKGPGTLMHMCMGMHSEVMWRSSHATGGDWSVTWRKGVPFHLRLEHTLFVFLHAVASLHASRGPSTPLSTQSCRASSIVMSCSDHTCGCTNSHICNGHASVAAIHVTVETNKNPQWR